MLWREREGEAGRMEESGLRVCRRLRYLFTPEEKEAWEKMDPADRPYNFIPQSFDALRKVSFV